MSLSSLSVSLSPMEQDAFTSIDDMIKESMNTAFSQIQAEAFIKAKEAYDTQKANRIAEKQMKHIAHVAMKMIFKGFSLPSASPMRGAPYPHPSIIFPNETWEKFQKASQRYSQEARTTACINEIFQECLSSLDSANTKILAFWVPA